MGGERIVSFADGKGKDGWGGNRKGGLGSEG